MHRLSDTVHDTLLVVVDEKVLFLSLAVLFPLFSGSELSNEIKSLLLALEHHVLLSTTTEETLKQDDSTAFLVTVLPVFLVQDSVSIGNVLSHGRVSSKLDLILFVFLIG